ncbi:melanoma-associated antigen B16-like [Phacochoerus africanus]|uniref:melanoma-associated antigen B16-like n=1 Tax=Phacochoerus africanus TaxID=41426 RepID=UPI001FD9303A|nr:melanoma-associated antigen B16-like [Phacochoerus africanus]
MSQSWEIPHCRQGKHHVQGPGAAHASENPEEASPSSSHSLMPGNLEEALAAGAPSACQGPWSACLAYAVTTAFLSSKSDPLDEKVNLLVQFLLQKYQKRADHKGRQISDVIREHKDDFLEVLGEPSAHLELVFGVDVKEVDPTSHGYALVNKLGLTYDARLSGDEGRPETSLLIIILGMIFMKGNHATEEEISEVLNTMD